MNAVLLWIVLFFSAMTGLSRVFVKEEDAGTAAALRLAAPPAAVLLGKLLANLALLFAVTLFVVPLFLAMMSFEIQSPLLFVLLLVFGNIGLASACTFTAAIVSKASAKGTMFAVLAVPLLLPPLVGAVLGTRVAATEDGSRRRARLRPPPRRLRRRGHDGRLPDVRRRLAGVNPSRANESTALRTASPGPG